MDQESPKGSEAYTGVQAQSCVLLSSAGDDYDGGDDSVDGE